MKRIISEADFKNHILASFPLSEKELERLMEEIHSFYNMNIKEYISLRHLELKSEGLPNDKIYKQLLHEIQERRFKSMELSVRQIRRIIYG